MPKTIVCFGDSNTYGYDPRTGGGRYPKQVRWTGIIENQMGCAVINEGLCGRSIPSMTSQIRHVKSLFSELLERDEDSAIIIMLGTNDLLQGKAYGAGEVAERMKIFLTELGGFRERLTLIAPPAMKKGTWVMDEALIVESKLLGLTYNKTAEELGISFINAGEWDIDLLFDGVHFSESGHRQFAIELMDRFDCKPK